MKGYKIVNRKFSTTVFWPLLAAAAILCAVAPAKAAEKEPNIVFMLMDNLGYGELGVYGGGILRGAPTPRIDKLASEGMRLLNFNVEFSVHGHSVGAHDGPLSHPLWHIQSPDWRHSGRIDAVGGYHRGVVVRERLRHWYMG